LGSDGAEVKNRESKGARPVEAFGTGKKRPPQKAAATVGEPQEGPSELGPYKDSALNGDLGGRVGCVKAGAALPHSKGDGV